VDDQGTQDLKQAPDGAWLSLTEAALELGLSAKTVRRRVRAGELLSRQVATQHGPAYEVWVGMGSQFNGAVTREPSMSTHAGTQRDATTLELVRLVDRLQREDRDLAGMVGSLQQRLLFAEDRIRALEAPREPSTSDIAPQRA
jgi:hypothetical protein